MSIVIEFQLFRVTNPTFIVLIIDKNEFIGEPNDVSSEIVEKHVIRPSRNINSISP